MILPNSDAASGCSQERVRKQPQKSAVVPRHVRLAGWLHGLDFAPAVPPDAIPNCSPCRRRVPVPGTEALGHQQALKMSRAGWSTEVSVAEDGHAPESARPGHRNPRPPRVLGFAESLPPSRDSVAGTATLLCIRVHRAKSEMAMDDNQSPFPMNQTGGASVLASRSVAVPATGT